jgi:RNA polymerase sigma factor (TIGR02999 family)
MNGMTEITSLLKAWENGDHAAFEELTSLVYDELHRMARQYVRSEGHLNPLQPTEVVNEAYLRLMKSARTKWHDRQHFLAVSAQIMRRILVDAARSRSSQKRGATAQHLGYSTAGDLCITVPDREGLASDLIALDEALTRLNELDARKAKVIELRFFGGLEVNETAKVLDVSPQTVMRDWRLARAWLARELRK